MRGKPTKEQHVPEPNLPEWTEYKKKNGLDPLGMQNSSVNLYQRLLPGIGNVTLCMRYYGLYAWLNWTYAQKIGETDPESWKRFVRRAEALYALIAERRGGESGVAGARWARRTLDAATGRTIDFAAEAEADNNPTYFAVKWGVYGLAYASQLSEVGILTEADEHDVPVPGPDIGDKLARAFQRELGDLEQPFYAAISKGRVSLSDLDRFSLLAPTAIRRTGAERKLYHDILLGQDSSAGNDRERRLSLLLVLKVAALLRTRPTAEQIRWILYAGKDERGRVFEAGTPALEAQRLRWRVYHANDLCHMALETLLKFMLDVLGRYPQGIPPGVLVASCIKEIIRAGRPAPASWDSFLDGLTEADNPGDPADPDSERALVDGIVDKATGNKICPPGTAWKALKLLGLVHRRYREDPGAIAKELGAFDPGLFHSLLTESKFLEQHEGRPFEETITRIIEERVMRRHLWVALRKFRHQGDYTFLIESDDGLVRLRDKDGPAFTNPRLIPSVRFLDHIHLIGDDGLTAGGMEVLHAT